MKQLHRITFALLAGSVIALPVFAEEMNPAAMDHNRMEVQQHGTTMMHTSPSDEDDMSHTMHKSPASKAATKQPPHSPSEHHADHDMGSMQHEMDEHSQHASSMTQKTTASTPGNLEKLKQLPPSGKSREANYDNSYFMHNTSLEQSLEARCALASRGLMMLDNESWKKCGGKPVGWSKGITSAQTDSDHNQHMNH